MSAPSEDVWLLMLDTCQYKDNEKNKKPQTDGRITDETYKWIEECRKLAKDNDAELVTVMHHNLMDHSEVVKDGFTLNDNQKAINNFLSNEIKFTLSGHIHVQDISSYKNPESSKKIYDITTGALSVYPQKYGVLKYASPNKAFDYSTEWVNVEDWAKENKNTDTNLLSFKEYSKKAFGDKAADMAYINLADVKGYSIEQINLMSETFKELNLKYFEGTENIDNESILNSEGYKLWQTNPPGFLAKYIQSISSDKDTDDNNLHIDNK
ncbi:3',5'-cyclic adenosine monophosphate phosphodiesterase CpdA [compost metagenome]